MRLYIVQHAHAKSEEEDPSRPLSEKGWKDLERVGRVIREYGPRPSKILHSGKLRAKQTAEYFQKIIGPLPVIEQGGLNPNDDPKIALELIQKEEEELMIVGHMPHLGKLVGLLVTGNPEQNPVNFVPGIFICLEKTDKVWKISWVVRPKTE